MVNISEVLPIANSLFITIGVGFVAMNQFKTNQTDLTKNTIQILKENIAAKDVEIAQMRSNHDAAIASLKSQIATITAQLEHLKQANIVLQNTVTGKETLSMIVEIMKPIPTLFEAGGFIDEARQNQQKTLKDLAEIRESLKNNDAYHAPKNRDFVKRSPKQAKPVVLPVELGTSLPLAPA